MSQKNGKRITIYDLAKELGISASYVSRALNNHPDVSEEVVERVKRKAKELNYKHNSHAANLRQGASKTVGVIVPHINQSFFSEAIAGMEEVCSQSNHSLIICQSHESFKKECVAIETLIHQNVDCIIISVSAETKSAEYLNEVMKNDIQLIQFDRCLDEADSYQIVNDNREVSYTAVKKLIREGYKRIAFIGGPPHITAFQDRKEGYIKAIKEGKLDIPYNFICDDALSITQAQEVARELLVLKEPPDAFFTVSDHQSLGILQTAEDLQIRVPESLGVFGFANEAFAELIRPTLSSIDQKSKEIGKQAANTYFNILLKKSTNAKEKKKIVPCEIINRQSSRKGKRK